VQKGGPRIVCVSSALQDHHLACLLLVDYLQDHDLPCLLLDDFFKSKIADMQPGWRRIVAAAAMNGVPVPAMSTALAFYDGYATNPYAAHSSNELAAIGVSVHHVCML